MQQFHNVNHVLTSGLVPVTGPVPPNGHLICLRVFDNQPILLFRCEDMLHRAKEWETQAGSEKGRNKMDKQVLEERD